MDITRTQLWEQVEAFEVSEESEKPTSACVEFANGLKESKPGLILVKPGNVPFLALEELPPAKSKKKTVGHAVIIAQNGTDIIEARGDGDGGINKVVRSNLAEWLENEKEVYVIWAAKGTEMAPDAVGHGAAAYAESKLGLPYNKNYFNRWDENSFYCSSLCWRAWNRQGYKLDYDETGPFDIKSKDWVSPNDLTRERHDCRVLYIIRK